MRVYQQRQTLELLKTIKKAQSEGLYAECQYGAFSIGTFIEGIEGENTQTVSLLEEYCELLYKANLGEISKKVLRKALNEIERSIRLELRPKKIEIAFLSYKASMSDSIESIYFAAKNDPSCDAYWIPIPYYERNVDGTLSMQKYEGAECYGADIQCTYWRDYDIEERHPDIIFTFAPYDDGNFVTTVHSDFYCKRLRELTDMLVYVPYFICSDEVQAHFCIIAGCVFAHKVIVQSEKLRNTYISVFKERYGNSFGRPEEKFVALGSPKLDKVVNAKRESFELPDKWKELINGKKVVFYNTGIAAMLEGNERYVERLRHTLNLFENCDDVVLWWRPHPLMEATFNSMRPQLADEYKLIVASYKRRGFGIYDDTPDLYRALAWSDAFYGDGSSVTGLFDACGKPVLIQSLYRDEDLNNEFLNFSSLAVHENCLYLTDNRLNNIVWNLDLETSTLKCFFGLPDYPFNKFLQFHNIRFHEGKCYVLPFSGDTVIVYDMKSKIIDEIRIPIDEELKNHSRNGITHLCNLFYKNKLFLFPYWYRAIIVIDINTKEVSVHTEWVDEMRKNSFRVDSKFFGLYDRLDDTRILLPSLSSNCVLEFDLETRASKVHKVGNSDVLLCGISVYEGIAWIVYFDKPMVLKWDVCNNSIVEIDMTYSGINSYGDTFSSSVARYENYMFLFPKNSNMVLKINMKTDEVEKVAAFDPYCTSEPERKSISVFNGVVIKDDWIFVNSDNTQKIFKYNIITEQLIVFDKNDLRRSITDADFTKVVDIVVKSFDAEHNEKFDCVEGTAGQAIFNYAKELILG